MVLLNSGWETSISISIYTLRSAPVNLTVSQDLMNNNLTDIQSGYKLFSKQSFGNESLESETRDWSD